MKKFMFSILSGVGYGIIYYLLVSTEGQRFASGFLAVALGMAVYRIMKLEEKP